MKAKKLLVLLLDVIVVGIIAVAMMSKTSITNNVISKTNNLLAENTDLSFDLIASPEEKRVKAGETVEITLSVKDIKIGEEGLNSIVGYLGYDEKLFDSMKIEGIQDWKIELNQIKNHDLYGKFCIYTMKEGIKQNEDVVKITLKLKDDLKPQTTKVTFTELASSDGEVEVPEEDREVRIIIYEENDVVPPPPGDHEEDTTEQVQTGDTKILVVIAVAILTIVLNILTFAKGSKSQKGKILSTILIMVLGLSCAKMVSYAAENINVAEVLNKLNIKESWLNSEEYLVTEENVSRIAPGTKVENIKSQFNKEIVVTKDGKEVKDGIIGTGMKISVKNPSNKDAEGNYAYEVSVWGDTNGDGKSNQVELTKIIRNVVDKEKWNITGATFKSADLTVDNKINEKDVQASVKYIVYGEMEIPEFEQVEAPTIEVVEGEYDEEGEYYTTDVKVKITEQAKNGAKTQYKVENSKGIVTKYTEISREQTIDGKYTTIITLPKDEIYKVSAYTTGELGNRSEIPYEIICGVYNKYREYRVEYYYKGLNDEEAKIDNEKTEKAYAEIGEKITTYTDKNKRGYELDKVEGLPLTISRNAEENVIKVYYNIVEYGIKYNPNGGEWTNGENPNPTVYTVETPTITITNPEKEGYEIVGWVEDEGDVPEDPKTIPLGTVGEIELTAEWEVIHYNIEYKGIEGATFEEGKTNPTTYTIEDETITLYNPSKENKIFTGWTLTKLNNEAQTLGTPNTTMQIPQGSTGDREYTANWEAIESYTVRAIVVGGNGTISPSTQQVQHGSNAETVIVTPNTGYRIKSLRLYSGEEIPENESEIPDQDDLTIGTDISDKIRRNKITEVLENVTENKLVVVRFEEAEIVVKIVAVPDGMEDFEINGHQVLGHEYTSLKDAIAEATATNKERDEEGKTGRVEIQILKDIDGEINTIKKENLTNKNEIIIDLNGNTISASNTRDAVITVEKDCDLTIIDRTEGTNPEKVGTIKNEEGLAILVDEGGELTLGVKEEDIDVEPSRVTPVIEGQTSGIRKEDGTIFNFYDGKIVSGSGILISGNQEITDTPTLYESTTSTEDGKAVATLKMVTGYEAAIGNKKYTTLEEAMKAVEENPEYSAETPVEIDLISDHTVMLEAQAQYGSTISCRISKNVILDLNGRKISSADSRLSYFQIMENATLTVKDTDLKTNGTTEGCISGDAVFIRNRGTFILDDAEIENNLSTQSFIYCDRIDSYDNTQFIMNGGTIKGGLITTNLNPYNVANITLNKGTIGCIGENIGEIIDYLHVDKDPINVTINGDVQVGTINAKNVKMYNGKVGTIRASETLEITGGEVTVIISEGETSQITGVNTKDIYITNGTAEISNVIAEKLTCSTTKTNPTTVNILNDVEITNEVQVSKNGTTLNIQNGKFGAITAEDASNVNIKAGEVTGNTAITASEDATITLGTKNTTEDTEVSIEIPKIIGTTKGITGGTLNFYDGIIIAPLNATLVNINIGEIEEQDSEGNELEILRQSYIDENNNELEKAFLGINTTKVAKIHNSYLNYLDLNDVSYELIDDYYEFTSLENATKACKTNIGTNLVKIELITNISQLGEYVIDEGKNIEIDLSGYNIEIGNVIENNGTLKLSDTNETKGTLNCEQLNNNSKLDINNITITSVITNNDELILNSGTIKSRSTYQTQNLVTNNAKMTINGGTISGGTRLTGTIGCIENNENATLKMTAGTLTGNSGCNGILNNSNKKYVEGESDPAVYVTGGTIRTVVDNGSGDLIFKQAQDSTINIEYESTFGNVTIDGGNYKKINVKSNSTALIKNASVEQIAVNEDAIVEVDNCNTTVGNNGEVQISNSIIEIEYNSGKAHFVDEVIVNNGITNNGEVILGTKDGNGDNANITINGGLNNKGDLYFYDGKIIGNAGQSIVTSGAGRLADVEEGYEILYTTVGTNEEATLQLRTPVFKIAEEYVDEENIGEIDNYKPANEDYYYFYNLTDAVNAAKDSTNATIYLLKNVTYTDAKGSDIISQNKEITLELDGYTIDYATNNAIINNGKLTIQDSSTNKTGAISTTETNLMSNTGTLILTGGSYSQNSGEEFLNNTSTGVVTIEGDAKVYKDINNAGTTTLNGVTASIINNTGTMTITDVTEVAKQIIYANYTIPYTPVITNSENGYIEINKISGYGEIINNTLSENENVGTKISGLIALTITNKTGYMIIDNATTGAITNNDKLTVTNNSTTGIITNAVTEDTSDAPFLNIESGTVNGLKISGVNNIPTSIGIEGEDYKNKNVVVSGIEIKKVNFYSGTIKYNNTYNNSLNVELTIPQEAEIVKTSNGNQHEITLDDRQNEAEIVGDREYSTLAEAINACTNNENKEIKLLRDIYVTNGREITIPDNKNITLDLNGKGINRQSNNTSITNNGILKIVDSTSEQEGYLATCVTGEGNSPVISNTNKLTIENITDNTVATINNDLNGEITITGSDIHWGIGITADGTVNVVNSKVSSVNSYASENIGTINISYNSEVGAVNATNAGLNVEDSTISSSLTANYNSDITINNSDVSKVEFGVAYNYDNFNITAHINDSTITNGIRMYGNTETTTDVTINNTTITGSGFGGLTYIPLVTTAGTVSLENCTITCTGGTTGILVNGTTLLKECTATGSVSGSGIEVRGKTTIIGGTYTIAGDAILIGNNSGLSGENTRELILGENNTSVDTEKPSIYGSRYGIVEQRDNANIIVFTTKFSFYDGIVKGGTKAIMVKSPSGSYESNITYHVDNYPKYYSVGISADEKELSLAKNGEYIGVVKVGDTNYDLDQLNLAVTNAIGTNSTIELVKDIALDETWCIAEEYNVNTELTINLNGYSITGNIEGALIENTVKLNIIDSEGNGYVQNTSEAGTAIQNNGGTLNADDSIIR